MSAEARTAPVSPPGPRPQPKSSQLIPALAGAVVGGSGTLLAFNLLGPALREPPMRAALRSFEGWGVLAAAGAIVVAWLVVVAAHELGHVLGGAAVRFRFFFFIVGPLRVEREIYSGAIRVRRNTSISQAGGMAASFPTDARDLPRRFFWFIFGGPLASLLFGLALVGAARGLSADEAPYARLALGAVGILSLLIFAVTMVPMSQGTIATDGARLFQLLRGELTAARHAATMPLIGLLTSGVAPRDWPRDLVERAVRDPDGTAEECQANLFAYSHYLDAGDVGRAGAHLDRGMALRETFPPLTQPSILIEAAYFEARFRGHRDPARELYAQIPPSAVGVQQYDRLRAEAAIALAEGNAAEARRLAEQALAATPERDAFSRGQLERLVRDADASVGACVVK